MAYYYHHVLNNTKRRIFNRWIREARQLTNGWAPTLLASLALYFFVTVFTCWCVIPQPRTSATRRAFMRTPRKKERRKNEKLFQFIAHVRLSNACQRGENLIILYNGEPRSGGLLFRETTNCAKTLPAPSSVDSPSKSRRIFSVHAPLTWALELSSFDLSRLSLNGRGIPVRYRRVGIVMSVKRLSRGWRNFKNFSTLPLSLSSVLLPNPLFIFFILKIYISILVKVHN